ncbi:MAG: COX15/CtaA family protein [Myxococcaceae bacterium]
MTDRERALSRFAWGGLLYTVGVILWGAYVRATKSGAGCGDHWPLCNGVVVPRAPALETIIEFTHRITSGLALVVTVVLVVWTFRVHGRGHPMRTGAVLSLFFMVTEALVGAGLVIFKMVAHNESIARAWWMGAHLVNTFLLLAAMMLAAHWSSGGKALRVRGQGLVGATLLAAHLGLLVVGVSGAIAALGDTLFPAESVAHGLAQDFSPTAHVLLRLRILHPLLAIIGGLLVVGAGWAAFGLRPSTTQRKFAVALTALFAVQIVAGLVNVILLAPVWLQLVHLLLADAVWLALVWASAHALAVAPDQAAATVQTAAAA